MRNALTLDHIFPNIKPYRSTNFSSFFFLFKIIIKDTMLVVANRNGMRIFNLFVDDKTE